MRIGFEKCCPFFLFCLSKWTPFYLAWLCKKGKCKKFFLNFNTFVYHLCTMYQKFWDIFCDIDLVWISTPVVKEWRGIIRSMQPPCTIMSYNMNSYFLEMLNFYRILGIKSEKLRKLLLPFTECFTSRFLTTPFHHFRLLPWK